MFFHEAKQSEAGWRVVEARILGTGAANPTKERGQQVVITRTGVGAFLATFASSEQWGTFEGVDCQLRSTLMTDLKNFSVIFGVYTAATKSIPFSLFNAAGAAAELAANQWMDLEFKFKFASV